ncbi:MAG: ROK family protein [Chloroflexota bacterium]|nr:ROK family protein [Chloroflexota bacterium]
MAEKSQNTERIREAKDIRVIGVDLGGTRIRVVLADGNGTLLERKELLTQASRGQAAVMDSLVQTIQTVMKSADFDQILGLAIGAPGPLNPKTGIIYAPPNLPGWEEVPLRAILEERLGLPVYVGNDANLAALGEYTYGAAKDYQYLVYITISTGIGGGIIERGRLLDGAKGVAGEIGHMTIESFGPPCKCGNQGCWEALASGTAIRRRAIEMVQAGRNSLLNELSKGNLEDITAELVEQAARQGDPAALELIDQTAIYLGIGITNILHLFNPEIVVLGGGVTQMGELLLKPLLAEVARRTIPAFRENVPIVLTKLGGDIGLYGAVALVLQNQATAKKHKAKLLKKPLKASTI